MTIDKNNIEKLPFFHSFIPDSPTKAVIDIKTFYLWLEGVQHIDFLSDAEEVEKAEPYQEFESGETLILKEAMKEW